MTPTTSGTVKKARVTPSDDDAFIQSDDEDAPPSAFSQSLKRFQKSPKKKGKLNDYHLRIYGCITLRIIARLTRHSDDDYDDDFIVPDDSEDDVASRSSRASKRSSRQSLSSGYDDDEAGTQTSKAKGSAGAIGRPSLKKTLGASGSANASTSNFLTAAEQRAQATKDGKKSQEDPFSFLLDVRDVWCILISSW